MTIDEFVKNLEEYFSYVKTVFLNEYGKFLDSSNYQKINEINLTFKIDENLKYKILVTDKITIGLDIKSYLEENNIVNDNGLDDIKIEGKQYIKELVDGKQDVYKLVFKMILKPIISQFIDKEKLILNNTVNMTVLANGTIDLMVDNLEKKCNLKFIKPFSSKEAEIVSLLIKIVGEKNYFNSILNGHPDDLEKEYNQQIDVMEDTDSFVEIVINMNDIYNRYHRFVGKNFLVDSLYSYQLLNYDSVLNTLKNRVDYNKHKNKTKIERIFSIEECLKNLNSHLTILEASEIVRVTNSLNDIHLIIDELNDKNLEQSYLKAIKIEDSLVDIIDRVWEKKTSHPFAYEKNSSFGFLIGNTKNEKVSEATLITDRVLKNIPIKLKKNYGYIYKFDKNMIYATDKDILWKRLDSFEEYDSTIKYNDVNLLVDDQTVSKLITPYVLEEKQIFNKSLSGKVLLYNPQVVGVFVLYDKIDSIDYEKAVNISENEGVDLVAIQIKNILSENSAKEEFKTSSPNIKEEPKPTKNLLDRIREFILEDSEQEKVR